jgi:outer membrane protein assembly factor BamB
VSLGSEGRTRHELLTLAGRNVVFCSNDGAVIALDAATGRRAWGFRYPRSKRTDANRSPEPHPAVASGGRVFVAPADGEHVYALDAETGQLLWESGDTEGAQILGVAAGRLVVAVAGPVRGIRGLNVATGSYREPDGWIGHDGGGNLSYGRGFVTDDLVVWPTRHGLFFLNPEDGSRIWTPHGTDSPFGNVAYADGVLVVVTPTQVWGYVSERKLFGNPRSGRDPTREKFDLLVEKAERALAAGDGAVARESLLTATKNEFPIPLRAWVVARLLLLTPAEARLPADLHAAIAPELLGEWLIPPDGVPVTLRTLLDRHLGRETQAAHAPPSVPSAEPKPEAPSLAPDTEVVRTFRVPGGAAPLRWLAGMATPRRVFLTTVDQLIAVPLAGGGESWHDAADRFTHAADLADGFVAAGPWAVAVYGPGRAPVWVFRVPTTDPVPARPGGFRIYSDELPPVAGLSSFRLTGAWLVARLGERHLIALDLRGRRVAWVLGACGTPGYRPVGFPDAARFGPEFSATGRLLVVQLSDGRRWFLKADTGKRLDIPGFGELTAKVWWVQPPAEVEANRLAVSDGPGLARVLNLVTGRVKWTHREDGDASLTGEPPQLRAWTDALLIAVRRNHGIELDRLDTSDGKSLWKNGPAFLDADRVNLAHSDADAEQVYVPGGNRITAFTLKNGRTAWEAELPEANGAGGWVVRAGQKCVIAYPEAAIPREPVADVLCRIVRAFRNEPVAWRLPGLAAGLYDAWVTRTVPVLLLDPETGKQLGKVEIPAAGPAVTAWFDGDTAVVATGDRVVWLR